MPSRPSVLHLTLAAALSAGALLILLTPQEPGLAPEPPAGPASAMKRPATATVPVQPEVGPRRSRVDLRALESQLASDQLVVRRHAVTELGKRPGPESVAILSAHLERETDPAVLGHAAIQLKRAALRDRDSRAAARLVALFRAADSPVVRGCVLAAFQLPPAAAAADLPHLGALAGLARTESERRTLAAIRGRYPVAAPDGPTDHNSR